MSTSVTNLQVVDWSTLPRPLDDGAAAHLVGLTLPLVALTASDGSSVTLASLPGRTVLYIYPMTGRPGVALPDNWDALPGARGCTPQSCAFRDAHRDLSAAGSDHVFGLSTQDTAYQREAAERLNLPFPLLSDRQLSLTRALRLPVMVVGDETLTKRLTLIIDEGRIVHVFYPVFPPDQNAADVLSWLEANPR